MRYSICIIAMVLGGFALCSSVSAGFICPRSEGLNGGQFKCSLFEDVKKGVKDLREKVPEKKITKKAQKALKKIRKEAKKLGLNAYIRSVEKRSTEYEKWKRNNAWNAPEGRKSLEFEVTKVDKTGKTISVNYEIHTIRYDDKSEKWVLVQVTWSNKSRWQMRWESLRTKIFGN